MMQEVPLSSLQKQKNTELEKELKIFQTRFALKRRIIPDKF